MNQYNSLLNEALSIQKELNKPIPLESDDIQNRIRFTLPCLSRTGEMLAEAKRLLRKRKSEEVQNMILQIAKENKLSATIQNTLLESIAEDEAHLVDLLERLNRTCVHQVDALRSLLSYAKEDLRLTRSGY